MGTLINLNLQNTWIYSCLTGVAGSSLLTFHSPMLHATHVFSQIISHSHSSVNHTTYSSLSNSHPCLVFPHWPIFAFHCSLFFPHSLRHQSDQLLLVTHFSRFTPRFSLFTVFYLLLTDISKCTGLTGHFSLLTSHSSLFSTYSTLLSAQ